MPRRTIGARFVMWEVVFVAVKVLPAPKSSRHGTPILCDIRSPLDGAGRLERNLRELLLTTLSTTLSTTFATTFTAAFAATLTTAFAAALIAALTAFVRRDQAPMNFPTGADGDGQGMFVGLQSEKNVTRRHAPMIKPQSALLRIKVRCIP